MILKNVVCTLLSTKTGWFDNGNMFQIIIILIQMSTEGKLLTKILQMDTQLF